MSRFGASQCRVDANHLALPFDGSGWRRCLHPRASAARERFPADNSFRRHGSSPGIPPPHHFAWATGRTARPSPSECHCRREGRLPGKGASRRRGTSVVRHPILDLPRLGMLTNVVGGNHPHSSRLFESDAGTVNAGAETTRDDSVDPGIDVGLLLGKHAAALFLIKKEDGPGSKALATGGGDRLPSVGGAELSGVQGILQCGVKSAVEKHEKPESGRLQHLPFASPVVGGRAGRRVEPETHVGKSLAKRFQVRVAGIVVAVKTEIGRARGLGIETHRGFRRKSGKRTQQNQADNSFPREPGHREPNHRATCDRITKEPVPRAADSGSSSATAETWLRAGPTSVAVTPFSSPQSYPPICTMVRDAGTKSGSPMWWRSSFFSTTPRMKSSNSSSEAPRRIWP